MRPARTIPDLAPARAEELHLDADTFDPAAGDVTCARAPGRLDVLGGVVDYSGGVVLEATIAETALVAVQTRFDRMLHISSGAVAACGLEPVVELPVASLAGADHRLRPEDVAALLRGRPESAWTAYVAGCLYLLVESGRLPALSIPGLTLRVESTVPIGAGVSSSAALEVASMTALCGHFGVQIDPIELAALCQRVENEIAGAPCGIMDQVTAALGRHSHLLALECQPHTVLGHLPIPVGWRLAAIDSGVKHSVGGRAYARARVAASMGLEIAQALTGRSFRGYLSNLSLREWHLIRDQVPETLTGAEFSRRFHTLPDPVARVDDSETYHVRRVSEHHLLENARVARMMGMLGPASTAMGAVAPEQSSLLDRDMLREAGELMLGANSGYSERLALDSPETDLLVELAMEQGPDRGIYGAKVTGGGSGGTVAILCGGAESDSALADIREGYERRTGLHARLLTGSSDGALVVGISRLPAAALPRRAGRA